MDRAAIAWVGDRLRIRLKGREQLHGRDEGVPGLLIVCEACLKALDGRLIHFAAHVPKRLEFKAA